MKICFALLVALAAGGVQAGALNVQLTPADMQRALTLARWPTSDAERARFHDRYKFAATSPTVEYFAVKNVEVITEFRRLELIAEEHARINDTFGRGGMHEVEEALRPWRGRVSIIVTLAFDPLKYITGVPAVDLALEGPTLLAPLDTTRNPLYSAGDHPILIGATIESVFNAQMIGEEVRPVFVHREGRVITRPAIDFSKLE
jgi:hypothetical protein